jgi:hypothetical protein
LVAIFGEVAGGAGVGVGVGVMWVITMCPAVVVVVVLADSGCCDMLSAVPFIIPADPGTTANIPANSTSAQITALTQEHTGNHHIWHEYLATDKALKQ